MFYAFIFFHVADQSVFTTRINHANHPRMQEPSHAADQSAYTIRINHAKHPHLQEPSHAAEQSAYTIRINHAKHPRMQEPSHAAHQSIYTTKINHARHPHLQEPCVHALQEAGHSLHLKHLPGCYHLLLWLVGSPAVNAVHKKAWRKLETLNDCNAPVLASRCVHEGMCTC